MILDVFRRRLTRGSRLVGIPFKWGIPLKEGVYCPCSMFLLDPLTSRLRGPTHRVAIQAQVPSTDGFFQEQLMAFEVWLQFAQGVLAANAASRPQSRDPWDERLDEGMPMKPPEQLPVVLQVLLSQVGFCATAGSIPL